MAEIHSRILRTELIRWREVQWLQGSLKSISKPAFARLKRSLLANSFIQPFNIYQENGATWILDGHHRKLAMEELEKEGHTIPDSLPANIIDCTDLREARKLVLLYASIYAQADEESLYEFIHVGGLDFDELKMQIDLPEISLSQFEAGWMTNEAVEDEIPEVPDEPRTKKGDLYEFGEHKLLCGDSTKAEEVLRLMNGKRAALCLTDPPYSVNYASREAHPNTTLQSYVDPKDATALLRGFISNLPCTSLIMTYADKQLHAYVRALDELQFETIDILVWKKQHFVLQPGARYQKQHEFIFLARKIGSSFFSKTPPNQSSVFEIDRKLVNAIHPTEKPAALWDALLRFHSSEGDLIYDPFLGSGTTLIRAEVLQRRCYGIEISPAFCDVIVQRWVTLTGKKEVKLNGERIQWL